MKISIPIKITNNSYLKTTNIKRNDKNQVETGNSFNFSSFSSNAIKNQFLNISFSGVKKDESKIDLLSQKEFDSLFDTENMGINSEAKTRFSKEQKDELAKLTNWKNKNFLYRLINESQKSSSGKVIFEFTSDEIVRIMQSWNCENDEVLEEALFQKDYIGRKKKLRYSVEDAILIAQMYPDNKNIIDEMLYSMTFDGEDYKYDSVEVVGLLKIFQTSKEKKDKYIQVFNMLKGYLLPVDDINDFLPLSYFEINEIINTVRQFSQESGLQDDVKIKFLQNNLGVEVHANARRGSSIDDDVEIDKEATLFHDGSKAKTTIEFYRNNATMTWYHGKDRAIYTQYRDSKQDIIDYQIEFKNNSQGEVQFVEYTKQSDKLLGAYDITEYDLKNYPEDLDIFGLLKKGELDKTIEKLGLERGKKLSSVESSDDETILTENFVRNGKTTSRRYVEKLDSKGQKVSVEYSYHIKDEDGKELLSLDRSWNKDSDLLYRTKVNGREYKAEFDEDSQNVRIYEGEELIGDYKTASILRDRKKQRKNDFLKFIKQLPVDLLFNMYSRLDGITTSKGKNDCYETDLNNINLANFYLDVVAHEMGHVLDIKHSYLYSSVVDSYKSQDFPYFEKYPDFLTEISSDNEVLETYKEEFDKFQKDYPDHIQYFVEYFSPYPNCDAIGIEEFVAETYMLLCTYGNIDKSIRLRADYLVKYFPMTVAKIAEKFKINSN